MLKIFSNTIRFILNYVNEIQSFEKRITFFEYLKKAITSCGFIYLKKTHSTIHDEKKWNNEFKRKLFFLTRPKLFLRSRNWFHR